MRIKFFTFVVLLSTLLFSGRVFGGQVNFGGGYGPQALNNWDDQYNGVVDLSYTFYETGESKGWQFLCGIGYSYVFTDVDHDEKVDIFSVLPSVRYNLKQRGTVTPFLEITIGPSYMSNKQLGNREQGSHFNFNDFFSIGMRWGENQEWEFRYSWRHLSNGNLFDLNPGWDIPFTFHVGRRF